MKTPLWLISGYLGSGKTTLLKRILTSVIKKIAIIMNEFGDIGIDTETIRAEHIEIKELLEGCVCCSLTGEFDAAIQELIKSYSPELIVVETTGVAEPDALIIDIEKEIKNVSLDLVINVVDADAMIRFPHISEIGYGQINTADVVVLNKKELISGSQLSNLVEKLRSINPRCLVIATSYTEFAIAELSNLPRRKTLTSKSLNHNHLDIQSFSLEVNKLNRDKFEIFLKNLQHVFRLKGHVQFKTKHYLLNYVAGRWNFEETSKRKTILVFIGEKLLDYKENIVKDLKNSRD